MLFLFSTCFGRLCAHHQEKSLSMWQLVFVTLCGWVSGMQGAPCIPDSHPHRVTNTKSHRYSYFSWWWAHSCPKHVEKRNKHTKKNCAPSWLYLQDYTGMRGQQHIRKMTSSIWGRHCTSRWPLTAEVRVRSQASLTFHPCCISFVCHWRCIILATNRIMKWQYLRPCSWDSDLKFLQGR
jgi:hypothetical protein